MSNKTMSNKTMSNKMRPQSKRSSGNVLIRESPCSLGVGPRWRVEDGMPGHQEFKALAADEVQRAAACVAEMQKWAREAYLSTKHVENVEDIWVRYFEAEHHLHWILPPATEPEES